MSNMGKRYQQGSIETVSTAAGLAWYIRFTTADGARPRFRVGLKSQYPTKVKAIRAAQRLRDTFNDTPEVVLAQTRTFNDVIDRYEAEEIPSRHSTARGYRNLHRVHIRPRWGTVLLSDIRPMDVRQWIRSIDRATRTQGHIHAQMRMLFRCAMLWEWVPAQTNPMSLFTITGSTKRTRTPRIITPAQFQKALQLEANVERQTMLIGAYPLGLRVSELFALKWSDFDHLGKTVWPRRAIVEGRVGDVKTEASSAPLPLAEEVNDAFLHWRALTPFKEEDDWVFTGAVRRGFLMPKCPKWLQQEWLRPLGKAMGLDFSLGWHSFRHSYKTVMVECDIDVTIQRDLMRHADIHTTMQIYGENTMEPMRAANAKVVSRIFNRPA